MAKMSMVPGRALGQDAWCITVQETVEPYCLRVPGPAQPRTSMRSAAPQRSAAPKRTPGRVRRLSTTARTPASASRRRTRSASSARAALDLELPNHMGTMTACRAWGAGVDRW